MSETSLVAAILFIAFYRLRPLQSGNKIRSVSRWASSGYEPVLTNNEVFFCYCLEATFENCKIYPDSEARIPTTTTTQFSQVKLARLWVSDLQVKLLSCT